MLMRVPERSVIDAFTRTAAAVLAIATPCAVAADRTGDVDGRTLTPIHQQAPALTKGEGDAAIVPDGPEPRATGSVADTSRKAAPTDTTADESNTPEVDGDNGTGSRATVHRVGKADAHSSELNAAPLPSSEATDPENETTELEEGDPTRPAAPTLDADVDNNEGTPPPPVPSSAAPADGDDTAAPLAKPEASPVVATSPARRDKVRAPGKMRYQDRIRFVQTLFEKSSATRQIDSGENPDAKAKREEARSHYERAQQLFADGEEDGAGEELSIATRMMFEAVRLAGQNSVVADKKRRDYQNRLDSINALMEAHERVSKEKGAVNSSSSHELRRLVADKLAAANGLLEDGELDLAKATLDEAYVAIKLRLRGLRDGDTLVRSLNFASKEEEYRYELDRNDSLKLLVQLVMKDKQGGMVRMIQMFVDKSEALRAEAIDLALQGDFESAVTALERATKNLTRALKSAGINVPG